MVAPRLSRNQLSGGAGGQRWHQKLRLQAELFAQRQPFAHGLRDAGDQHLVDRLGGLAATGIAHVGDAQRVGLQRRPRLLQIGRIAADHDRELAVPRAFDATGNRRVEKADALRLEQGMRRLGGVGGNRGMVDHDAARQPARRTSARTFSSTSSSAETQSITTSHPAKSTAVAAAFTGVSAANCSAFENVRLPTAPSSPCACKCPASEWPMAPNPMNPTRIGVRLIRGVIRAGRCSRSGQPRAPPASAPTRPVPARRCPPWPCRRRAGHRAHSRRNRA